MGTFEIEIQIAGPSRNECARLNALVDTGSTYTVLPCDLLERLGV